MDMLSLLKSCGIKVYRSGETGGKRDKHISSDKSWVQMVCPLCGTDHLWLGYNVEKDYFNCFNHGHTNKYDLFRAWFPDRNPREFFDLLDAKFDSDPVPTKTHAGSYLPPQPICRLTEFKRHCAYIRGRGLDPDEMEKRWGWGALPADAEPRYRDRIFIPVHNRDGVPVSWQTRTILQNEPNRYLAAPKQREAETIKHLLYGEHLVNPFKAIIVCEGVFDAVAIGQNAVATFGKSLTPKQKMKVARYPRCIFVMDSEEDTQEQAQELAHYTALFGSIVESVRLDAPDPATAPKKEIDALLRYAELI